MSLTKDQIQGYIYDPSKIQKLILEYLEQSNEDKLAVIDPTNPFTMLLEAAAVTASNAVTEINNVTRKQYPSLANVEDDIFHHITDNELTNMFAVPAEVAINFYVNIIDMKANGYRPDGANYVQTTIPKDTSINILDTYLTLLNDITVRLYDNSSVYVEQHLNSDNDLAYDDIGTLQGEIITSSEGTPWIKFTTKIKQLRKYTVNKAVLASTGFKQIINITDKYCFAQISYKNDTTNGVYKIISKTHSEDYIDPQVPTCYISLYDKNILFKIPDVYLVEGMISGNVNIDVYDTKGKIYLPIDKYTPADFVITLGDTNASASTLSAKKMSIMADSKSILDGGRDNSTMEELRSSIINNTTGDIDLPITDYQLTRLSELNGFTIVKATDVVTSRLYYALKSLPNYDSSLIYAKADVFFNTCKLVLEDIKNYDNIVVNDDIFIIKSNNIFKEDNGVITLTTPEQLKYIQGLENIKLINHLEDTKYFFNPFYYIITLDEDYATSRVYDLDNPDITATRILEKNLTLTPRVNINKYGVIKSPTGYRIIVTLTPNTEFSELEEGSVKLQMKLPLFGSNTYAYIDADYNKVNDMYAFDIITDLNINSDNLLDLKNGVSDIATKRFALDADVLIYIMSTDASVLDPSKFLQDEIYVNDTKTYVVFTKEQLSITFGTELDHIYNKLYNAYTQRKYRTYDYDVPAVYEEDVYQQDPKTGSIFSVTSNNISTNLEYKVLHKKGDPILDKEGNPTYKYKKGDTILDTNGNPIIDTSGGLVRYIDMLLLEYEFYRANSTAYTQYKDNVLSTLKKYITSDLKDINNKLLENTKVLYRSYKSSEYITIIINNNYSIIPYNIIPDVTLYMSNTSTLTNDLLEEYKNTIGSVFNDYLDNSILKLEDLKTKIKEKIGSTVTGVKITGIEPTNAEVINIKDENTKLVLNKVLSLNKNNEYVVKYDIKLTVQYI